MLIKVMWCTNCDRPEPGGGRCKFCGRKLTTIEKLPHELRVAGMADKTFTFYGFNHCFNKKFSGSKARVASFVGVEVPHPDQTPISRRRELETQQETEDFDRQRYMVDFVAGTEGPLMTAFLNTNVFKDGHPPLPEKVAKRRINHIKKAAESRESYDSKLSIQPWQILTRPKMVLPNMERMQLWTAHQAQLHLFDIVACFLHEQRLRATSIKLHSQDSQPGGALPSIESTNAVQEDCSRVVKLCSTFSWFATHRKTDEMLRSLSRRLLCYSELRHWAVVEQTLNDAMKLFNDGPHAVLLCILQLHTLLDASDQTRFYNELFMTDFVCWTSQLPSDAFHSVSRELTVSINAFQKSSCQLPLHDLEVEANGNPLLLQGSSHKAAVRHVLFIATAHESCTSSCHRHENLGKC